jgi:2-polyprenyl-3-methyl-5-hydroxy-6-metoxy-1,4-benzoquinol methylase
MNDADSDLGGEYEGYVEWKRWHAPFTFSKGDGDYFAKEIGRFVPKGGSILEIGFGSGKIMAWARQAGYEIVGVEIIEAMVVAAREKGFEACNLDDLAPDRQFDLVTAMSVLEHLSVEQLQDLFEKTARHLAPGGVAIFRFPNGMSPFGRIHQNGDITHRQALTPSRIQQILDGKNIPLTVVEARNPAVAIVWRSGFAKALGKFFREIARAVLYRSISAVVDIPHHLDPNLVVELRLGARTSVS